MIQNIGKLVNISHEHLIYPKTIVKLSNKVKLKVIIRKILGKHKTIDINTLYWTTALLLLGLENSHKTFGMDKDLYIVDRFTKKILKQELKGREWLIDIDQAMNGYPLIYFKDQLDSPFINKMINDINKFLIHDLIKSADGSIPYRQENKNLILIDSIGMVCPFLARYGRVYHDNKSSDLCKNQIISYLNNGIDKSTGLPFHGYNAETGEKVGTIGWGRGMGWLAIGIVDSLEHLKNDKDRETIQEFFVEFMKNITKYQDTNGYIRSSLLNPDSEVDSSATAMIGYSLLRGFHFGLFDEGIIGSINLAYNALKMSMDSKGFIGNVQGDTLAVNNYANCNGKYWAQGIGLAFISLYEDLIKKEIS